MDNSPNASLHENTLILMERTGVRVESEPALKLLADRNVRIDWESKRVHPRPDQVQQALDSAPRSFNVYGRLTENPLVIGSDNVYVESGGASVRVLALDGHYEAATWEHLRQFNTLLDALPNIHMLLNQVDPLGDPSLGFYQRLAAEMLITTPKPCCFQAGSGADVTAMVAMGAVIRGSTQGLAEKPVFITGSNAEPPLCIPEHAAEILMTASRAGIPCGVGDYVMMGISAPTTLAGALIQRNAVQLIALVLSQMVRPGAPFYYTGSSASANMRTLDPITANPAALRMLRAAVRLGRWYGLPVVGLATTDAKQPDPQAAVEMAVSFLVAMEAGAHLIQGPTSMMDQMMLSSFAQAVIDNDIVGYLLAARGDLAISPETLAIDVIDQVVTNPSLEALKFAGHPHTARHLREDLWEPAVFSYDSFTTWQKKGSLSLLERANVRARDILSHHQPEPLALGLASEIHRIAHASH